MTFKKQLIGALCCTIPMKRGIAAEDSEGEKWWHQRGEDWRCLWRFRLWGQKEVTENGKKNHVLHGIVFIARIPPLLWRREKVLSKLYWLVLSLEVGDFKASSMRKLILTPLTISRHRGSDFTRGMNIPYCSETLSYQTQSWGRFYLGISLTDYLLPIILHLLLSLQNIPFLGFL